ncbi:Metallo-beta-lactamase superfamily protein [Venustampulla echinocandica]|uniref:Metallo-beta-lactamase superfamily protein n=1 Tax=Venustampulla echinocandica TaxID=2656787 RepID=A0A370TJG2_9HELO|nr:Metallo-beta-lactamase superfamily protein [Venustampulla echinocandica]RDL35488.1 Metallo-beta-lactamase superfamily protein [Venustampulla echinocandica]
MANSQRTMTDLLANAKVPVYMCPPGTKMWILNLGTLTIDEGWYAITGRYSVRAGNTSTGGNKNPENKQRDLVVMAVLIQHPQAGLILFETGCAENVDIKWGFPATDLFPRTVYNEEHKLPAAIKSTGNDIKDVKAVIMGHLHLDHAGGLEHFVDTGVPIITHEEEFKHACWAVATKADLGVYLGNYMDLEKLNWQTFTESHYELYQGITLHHPPGHTPGLCAMQINLQQDGTFIFTTDQYHIKENFTESHPQGWLARDHTQWCRSNGMIKNLQAQFHATLVFGHDMDVYLEIIKVKTDFQ